MLCANIKFIYGKMYKYFLEKEYQNYHNIHLQSRRFQFLRNTKTFEITQLLKLSFAVQVCQEWSNETILTRSWKMLGKITYHFPKSWTTFAKYNEDWILSCVSSPVRYNEHSGLLCISSNLQTVTATILSMGEQSLYKVVADMLAMIYELK